MKSSLNELPLHKDLPEETTRKAEWGGMNVNLYEIHQTMDSAPLAKGLPDDQCQVPHWGYILKGKMRCKIGDREEVYNAGDVFYQPPGHNTVWEAGLVYISFTPTDAAKKQKELMQTIAQES